jgi:hypothetical protein
MNFSLKTKACKKITKPNKDNKSYYLKKHLRTGLVQLFCPYVLDFLRREFTHIPFYQTIKRSKLKMTSN